MKGSLQTFSRVYSDYFAQFILTFCFFSLNFLGISKSRSMEVMTRNRSASRQLEILTELPLEQSHQLDLLSFVSDELGLSKVMAREKRAPSSKAAGPQFHGHIDRTKTFATFCLGDSNYFAVEAIKRFIQQEKSDYGLVYLMAESGLGKTHILHAVANELRESKKSFYIGSPLMMNYMLENFNSLKIYDFLLIDDIEEVCGQEELQKSFCQLFDYAQMGAMKIIITGGATPKDLRRCEDRFKGKLSAGLSQVIGKMDQALARSIVASKCKSIQLDLPAEVSNLVTENIEFNAYGLENVLHKLKDISSRGNSVVTMEIAKAELPQKIEAKIIPVEKPVDNFSELVEKVAGHFQITSEDILDRSRKNEYVFARHAAMFVVRERLNLSYPQIAKIFKRDHSSVMYGINRMKQKIQSDSKFANTINTL